MNHLIVIAHPKPDSFCHAMAAEAFALLPSSRLLDLYQVNFDPVLSLDEMKGDCQAPDLEMSRDSVEWADHILFIFPVWWYDRPAILKGWIERVFSYGFAYKVENGRGVGLLKGKTATVVATFGSTEEDVEALSPSAADWVLGAMAKGTLQYCGFEEVERIPLFGVDKSVPELTRSYLEKVRENLQERFS